MLKQKLVDDQILALRSQDRVKLSTLRYILAQIKNKEIEKRGDLSEEEVISVLRKIGKELRESIEAFVKGKRPDLVTESQKQLEIIINYLPKDLSDEQLKKEVEKVVSEYEKNRAGEDKNPKALIGVCIKALKSKADPARIVKILQEVQKV